MPSLRKLACNRILFLTAFSSNLCKNLAAGPDLPLGLRPALVLIVTPRRTLSHGNVAQPVDLHLGEPVIRIPTTANPGALAALLRRGLVSEIVGMITTGNEIEIVGMITTGNVIVIVIEIVIVIVTASTTRDTAHQAHRLLHGNSNLNSTHSIKLLVLGMAILDMAVMAVIAVMLRLPVWALLLVFRRPAPGLLPPQASPA